MKRDNLLEEYESKLDLYNKLATSMGNLINTLLNSSSIIPHSISCRVKERSSLSRKIDKKDKYDSLSQITDIAGLRIISNYADEVDKIAKIIESEFCVDEENSIDKRAILDPDRFGYLSLHYVVSLKPERTNLVEYMLFSGIKFEVQIRSILQHTWAEIEHDIGYKAKIQVPMAQRRKFSMLAGLLELADDQFIQIRDELRDYEENVATLIQSNPETIGIDLISVCEYANESSVVKEIDDEVANLASFKTKALGKEKAGRYVEYLQFFKIESIAELEKELIDNKEYILKRARGIDTEHVTVNRGISIFYLFQVLAAKKFDRQGILKFLDEMNLARDEEREEFVEYLLSLI